MRIPGQFDIDPYIWQRSFKDMFAQSIYKGEVAMWELFTCMIMNN